VELDVKGPVYTTVVSVDGVRTKAFLDFGAQVSLVRRQMLPKIRLKQQWSEEECHKRSRVMTQQPLGAGGGSLGATGIASLCISVESTGSTQMVPCYILDSSKPIWRGELRTCGVLLGTNALEALGFQITLANGAAIESSLSARHADSSTKEEVQPSILHITLLKELHLGPLETRLARAKLDQMGRDTEKLVGVLGPTDNLAAHRCDFVEELWTGAAEVKVPISNWSNTPVVIPMGQVVGEIEEVSVIGQSDRVWEQPEVSVVAQMETPESLERQNRLREQLVIGDGCQEGERQAFIQMLCVRHNVFALSDAELGETDLVEHQIELVSDKPVRAAPRRLPYALRAELEAELLKLLDTGCIEPSSSPYASGLVLVRKKDGGLRVCVDYRELNKNTVPDRYPIPRIDELIDTIGCQRGKIFTSLDLMKGYHQVKVAETSKSKTAFTCHQGLYQYRRMPFGLTNAPATFQRLMSQLFAGKQWKFVYVYLDDILIVSGSAEEHLVHVGLVLKHLEEAGLRVKPSKCAFAQVEIEYLGYTLSSEGVLPNSKKVQAISELPRPSDTKAVKSFLGMINFYRRHVRDLASIARPLTALTRKDKATGKTVKFVWDSECEAAFEKLKILLVTTPVLRPPDLTKEFFLWTDASTRGFGAVLEQLGEDGSRHPIAFASRQTNPAESKYAPTELEVAALVFGVEHFEVYLLGNPVTVYTDHQALVSAFLSQLKSQTKGLLARWYLRLSRFLPLMKLEFKPGHANVVADGLSRAPVQTTTNEVRRVTGEGGMDLVVVKVQKEQQRDEELADIIQYLGCKNLPECVVRREKVLAAAQRGYYVTDGILYYESAEVPNRRRLVVPAHLRQQVVDENHDPVFAGHFSEKKLMGKLSRSYFWPGMRQDVSKKCTSCVTCASA